MLDTRAPDALLMIKAAAPPARNQPPTPVDSTASGGHFGVTGDVSIGKAQGGVEVKNTNGDIYVGEVVRGKVALETTRGSLGVGVREGTAAHLDAHIQIGGLNNELSGSTAPADTSEAVQLRTRTVIGDINIHRA